MRPLANELTRRGWKVWLDELQLTVGDSLSNVIDEALVRSRFGIVVLSRAFFAKPWRREIDRAAAPDFFKRQINWLQERVKIIDRILAPSAWERAFGERGEEADPTGIENLARRIIVVYEWMLDWAAELRNTSVPSAFAEIRDATACFVDGPLKSIRDVIDKAEDQIASLPELAVGATIENPVQITLELKPELDPAVVEWHSRAWKDARRALGDG